MSFRIEKVSSTLKSAIGGIFLKMSDPDLRIITVSDVILSNDLKIAKIYVSSFDGNPEELLEKLNNARGYIKRELSKAVYLKYLPDLQFFFDLAFEFDQRVSNMEKE